MPLLFWFHDILILNVQYRNIALKKKKNSSSSSKSFLSLAIFLILIIFASVIYFTYQPESEYANLPDFIFDIFVSEVSDPSSICAVIDPADIYHNGDFGDDIRNQVSETISVRLDSFEITDTLHISMRDTIRQYLDNDGNIVGSHGGHITVCFATGGLSSGIHSASMFFQDTQEISHIFLWQFEINRHGEITLFIEKS